jgi:hypothetical protein
MTRPVRRNRMCGTGPPTVGGFRSAPIRSGKGGYACALATRDRAGNAAVLAAKYRKTQRRLLERVAASKP